MEPKEIREKIKKMILQEIHMLGMGQMSAMPMKSLASHSDYGHDAHMAHGHHSHSAPTKGSVSREDCCLAIKCLVECCECPITKQAILDCCSDILMGRYD